MILIKHHFLGVVHPEATHGQNELELKMSNENMGSQLQEKQCQRCFNSVLLVSGLIFKDSCQTCGGFQSYACSSVIAAWVRVTGIAQEN